MHLQPAGLLLWEVISTNVQIRSVVISRSVTIVAVIATVPKCQGHEREEWISKREDELIKVPYYHIVFTLPSEFNCYALYNPKLLYGLLFKVAWSVIKDFAANPKFMGANTGMISILHTWGQNLSLHPHLHCIVPGGGLNNQKWKFAKGKDKYLFPVKAVGKVFRARFMEEIRKHITIDNQVSKALFSKNWVCVL